MIASLALTLSGCMSITTSLRSFAKQPLDRIAADVAPGGFEPKGSGKTQEFAILLRLQFRVLQVSKKVLEARVVCPGKVPLGLVWRMVMQTQPHPSGGVF